MYRRTLISTIPLLASGALLAGCVGTPGAVTFAQARAYMDDAVDAVLAAAQAYIVGTPRPPQASIDVVISLSTALENARTALDATTVVANWQAGAIEALAVLQQLTPLVAAFLGAAAPYVPLAIAVIEAFIQSLPPPPAAPVTPPAALAQKALQYHRRQ